MFQEGRLSNGLDSSQRWNNGRLSLTGSRRTGRRFHLEDPAAGFLSSRLFINRYLSAEHGLDCIQKWLEIPLDSIVADKLKKDAGRRSRLPVWKGLRNLKKDDSKKFQDHARELAARESSQRVHLDVVLWVNKKLSKAG